jgi:hypothetical protein
MSGKPGFSGSWLRAGRRRRIADHFAQLGRDAVDHRGEQRARREILAGIGF